MPDIESIDTQQTEDTLDDNAVTEETASQEAPSSEVDAETLDQRVVELEAEATQLRAALEERDIDMSRLQGQATSAVAKYREALLLASPEVPQELVTGQTIEEIDTSMAQARQMVERIRNQIEAQTASERVPSGAPLRSAPDLSSLSPAAKIAYGLTRNER